MDDVGFFYIGKENNSLIDIIFKTINREWFTSHEF